MRVSTILATNVVDGTVFAYAYDDIGNRLWSREFGTNCTYAANELNQYTNIVRGGVVEQSAFDADGNQTDIITGTGRWLVEYNGESRPVRWTRPADGTVLEMSYDWLGRRISYGYDLVLYDGCKNITEGIWDPTEDVVMRVLAISFSGGPCLKLGPFIKWCLKGNMSYDWSDCGQGKNELSGNLELEQCLGIPSFGTSGCWNVKVPILKKEF